MEIDDERPVVKPKKDKSKKKTKKKATSGLSFGDEVEEEEDFKIKKSSRSKKIAAKIRAEVEEERKENKGSYWGSSNYSHAELDSLKIKQNSIPTENEPFVLNGDDLDKMKEKDLKSSSFREKVLDKIGSSAIPDANEIHAARKKREEARRKAKGDDSFLPINGNKKRNIPTGRRIDNTGSDNEEERVIKMDINQKVFVNDDIDEGREKDDEGVRRWETNLIRGSAIAPQSVEELEAMGFSNGQKKFPADAIREKLGDLRERLAECKNNKVRMEQKSTADPTPAAEYDLEDMYCYFQEMRAWLKDYTLFVNCKMDEMTKWHSELRETQAEVASVRLRRRQLDVKDAGLQFTFNAPKNGNENLEEDVKRRIREREARRTRRKLARQMKNVKNHRAGESTDEELDAEDDTKFAAKFAQLDEARRRLLDDVIDEYTDSRILLNRFNKWREAYPRFYTAGYGGECASSVIMPIVQIEMNGWTPESQSLHETKSIKNAIYYSCQGDEPDKFLLPHLVGHYPLESVSWWVAHSWDPLSRRQTESLVHLLNSDLWRNLPWAIATDDKFKPLIEMIHKRLSRSIAEDVYLPLLLPSALDPKCGAAQFFWRQWHSALKLISNLSLFSSILSAETIQQLILDKIVNGQLLLKLNNLPKVRPKFRGIFSSKTDFVENTFRRKFLRSKISFAQKIIRPH